MADLIGPHGAYRELRAYQMTEIIYDGTVAFAELYINRKSRTIDQMVQAARSGKQNIAEGCMVSGTSKKFELKLVSVARGSLEELLQDYEDFLRQRSFAKWAKEHEKAKFIRRLAYRKGRTYETYKPYVEEKGPENAGNTMICVIHQANYLLDRFLRQLEKRFLEEGGFTERMHRVRSERRKQEGLE